MQHSSANPITYVQSLMVGRKTSNAFSNVRTYVMFIGQPRSGTSLLGSLLNAHQNVLVSQELNALKYLRRGYGKNQLFWLIQENERKFAKNGRKWTGYQYNVDSKWQGNYDDLLVIGDKKAGKSTEQLTESPDLLDRLQTTIQLPVRIVHIVRNPYNVIATIHRKVKNTTLEAAAEMYFSRCATNWKLMQQRSDQIYSFHLEDFIADPNSHLHDLCSLMNVAPHKQYIQDCSNVVFKKPNQTMFDVMWSSELVNSIAERMKPYPFLERYEFQVPDNSAAA